MDWKTAFESDPRFGGLYRKVARPAWPTRAAIFSGLLVVTLPLLLVVLTGVLVAVLVYVAGNLLMKIGDLFTGGGGDGRTPPEPVDDVRDNVRVIPRS